VVRIPNGVAHGVANIYQRSMTLFYATSSQFNSADPDEHRLPWDQFGSDIWELVKG
jgi:dTDP-4-dehydrorhamnose 3,5-epimerase